jgi:hypothetical protein
MAVAVATPLKVPLAGVVEAVNVTVTPLNGLLPPSFTVACKGVVNALFTFAVWELPAVALMLPEAPAAFKARTMVETCGLPKPFQVAEYELAALPTW